jgi:hypothetical protein
LISLFNKPVRPGAREDTVPVRVPISMLAVRIVPRFCRIARTLPRIRGRGENDARRSLEKITLTRTGQLLKVRTPQHSRERPTNAWLQVEAARHRAVTVNKGLLSASSPGGKPYCSRS